MVAGIAILLVVVLVGGSLTALLTLRGGSPSADDPHRLTTPTTAGELKRDTVQEKALGAQLQAAAQQFKQQAPSVSYVRSAVYKQGDTAKGPAGGLVFLGAKLGKKQDPTRFISDFRTQATSNPQAPFKVTTIDPGDGGGEAACASTEKPQKVAICAWATSDTIGELVPTVPGYGATQLAEIMRAVRADVEQAQ